MRLAGGGSNNTPGGGADPRAREHAVGDVKQIMVRGGGEGDQTSKPTE